MKKLKKLILAMALSAAGMGFGSAQAQSTSGTFFVNIALTSACSISAITDLAFAYTSFQVAAQPATGGGLTVTCTNSLPYSFGLQAGIAAASPPGAVTIGPINDSVVLLNYTLTRPASNTGNGAAQVATIAGSMPGGQSGTCATSPPGTCSNAGATNRNHTLIANF